MNDDGIDAPPTWLASDRPVARYVGRPIARFLHVEAAGGILLLAATVVALVWANSPWKASYETLWETRLIIVVGDTHAFPLSLHKWVNDGLMALFFFVVGLEIKSEVVNGSLRRWRDAALPAFAAVGGMAVPALVFVALNAGGDGSSGWGIPMATDIAFAVGVMALLGDRVPSSLKVLLLALAIVDDIGAIVVIALFYTDELSMGWLAISAISLLAVAGLRYLRVWYPPVYVVIGLFVWFAVHESGVHATIAGVLLGLLTPARPLMPEVDADRVADELSTDEDVTAADVRRINFAIRESVSVADRLAEALHPWTSYLVVPLFALANAGIVISGDALSDAVSSPVTLGVVLGLVVGKPVGIVLLSWLAVRTGVARLPDDVTRPQLVGMGVLAGIGFTVSLFITDLAFAGGPAQDPAKLGVLAASAVAAVVGLALLARATRRSAAGPRGLAAG